MKKQFSGGESLVGGNLPSTRTCGWPLWPCSLPSATKTFAAVAASSAEGGGILLHGRLCGESVGWLGICSYSTTRVPGRGSFCLGCSSVVIAKAHQNSWG